MAARLVLLAVNLLPLMGVAFWGWDAFELLVLYWCETAVIAFWTIVQVVLMPARGGAFRAIFLAIHAGIFMTVHMMFLWSMFGGAWEAVISGPIALFRTMLIEQGLWVPLAGLFAVRGILTLAGLIGVAPDAASDKAAIYDLYRRIIVLQLTLIAGGWATKLVGGSTGPVILVGLKIAIDLLFDPFAKAQREQAA